MKATSIVTAVSRFVTSTAALAQGVMLKGEVKKVDENASMPKQFQVDHTV